MTSIKSKEDKYRFKVFFKNDIDVPITIYWIDYKGKEVEKKTKLPPQEVYSTHTYFTHHWIFRKSDSEDKGKLLADANAIQNLIFEGEKFLAVPNEKIEVYISESKLLVSQKVFMLILKISYTRGFFNYNECEKSVKHSSMFNSNHQG